MTDGTVKSAQRVFEILEHFERERRPLTLKEVLDHLGYPASSGSALLKSIVALGYLDYDSERRTYFPTMRIAALGDWVHGALFEDSGISDLMQHLHQISGETVILAAQSDLHAQYIHLIQAADPLHFSVPPGTRRPLAKSGMGWLLLSAKGDDDIEKIRRRINADRQAQPALPREELMQRIKEVREQGYVFSKHTVSDGVGVIAALLPRGPFGRVFAVGVAGPVSRLERKAALIVSALQSGIARCEKGNGPW